MTTSTDRPGRELPVLSSPLTELRPHYEVLVVGSGYGGAIAASRLARAGRDVCLLERGREIRPGEYPETMAAAGAELQVRIGHRHLGRRNDLFDIYVGDEISVVKGCGLGGTSLINANVSLEASPEVFEDDAWPSEVVADLEGPIQQGYARALAMLGAQPLPGEFRPDKLGALEKSAEVITDGLFYRPPINVTFADGPNAAGIQQRACTGCGNCVSGCNEGAKNTVLMNYLPDAVAHGARIFTNVDVDHVAADGDKWRVYCRLVDSGRDNYGDPVLPVTADVVVLAAGALGSTEILLRSRREGLTTSAQLGQRFTGNGDVLGFSYNGDQPIDGMGREEGATEPWVGPCITGIIDNRSKVPLADQVVVEDGSIPGALAGMLPAALAAAATAYGQDTDIGDSAEEHQRIQESLLRGPWVGATANTQTYLVMAHDDGAGELVLDGDQVRVDWPKVGKQPIFEAINERLQQATVPLGGTYLHNPAWSDVIGRDLVTVHPLGGCAMGTEAGTGVVDHRGEVFSGPTGTATHRGLYVADGSVVPRPLGVNPLLTISALAERCCELLAEERDWQIAYDDGGAPPPPVPPAPVQLVFTETMKGWIDAPQDGDDDRDDPEACYRAAAERGKDARQSCSFLITVVGDIPRFFDDPEHPAPFVGSAEIPMLGAEPFAATDGLFNLFMANPTDPDVQNMRYRMALHGADGAAYLLTGYKVMRDDFGFDTLSDTTTLYTQIHEGADGSGALVARGVLHVRLRDLMTQITGLQVWNTDSAAERGRVKAGFITLFLRNLADKYLWLAGLWKDDDGRLQYREDLRPERPAVRLKASGVTPAPPATEVVTPPELRDRWSSVRAPAPLRPPPSQVRAWAGRAPRSEHSGPTGSTAPRSRRRRPAPRRSPRW